MVQFWYVQGTRKRDGAGTHIMVLAVDPLACDAWLAGYLDPTCQPITHADLAQLHDLYGNTWFPFPDPVLN